VKTGYIVAISVGVSVAAVLGMMYFTGNEILEIPQSGVSEEYFDEYKQWARNEIDKYEQYAISLQNEIGILRNDLQETEKKYDVLRNDYKSLRNQYALQSLEIRSMKSASDEYVKEVEEFYEGIEEYLTEESLKPKTTISEQKINWEVSDSKGNKYNWSMPIESYESFVRATEPQATLRLETDTGKIFTVRDHTKFVQTGFKNVIDQVYDNSDNDADFVREVWYIVSQLTTYSYDIGEDPRWALKTLSRGGGDCEDTAILIAEMLKSSKHTNNWEINLVYFDAYNPDNPQTMNHVAVHVKDGNNDYIIESTAKENPYAWPDGVTGWFFEV